MIVPVRHVVVVVLVVLRLCVVRLAGGRARLVGLGGVVVVAERLARHVVRVLGGHGRGRAVRDQRRAAHRRAARRRAATSARCRLSVRVQAIIS